jgi:sn-glycerol 3-phosphate transport system substrate-binding protein
VTLAIFLAALVLSSAPAAARTTIHFWHAMTGQLGEATEALVKKFNDSQAEYEVKAINKGNYSEVLTLAVAAYRAKNPPHLVQVFEVGTQTMLLSDAIVPVHQLMKDQGISIAWDDFIKPVIGYYTKEGNLYSMPFNSSTPIFYYNKEAFQKAGLDAARPPATWHQVEEAGKKLLASGAAKCGFTVGWPSWTMVENMHAWHDQPFATRQNGFGGLDVQLLINGEFGVKHIGQLAAWQKDKVFDYGGRRGDAGPKFINGDCAMFIQSSALIGSFVKQLKFQWGTAELPHWGAPYRKASSIIGGATVWVMKGQKAAEYKGVAQFLKFIASTEQQAWWHASTGYLAISNSALQSLEKADHFKKQPFQWTAFAQLTKGTATANSQGLRLGNFVQIRDVIETELENIFAGKKAAKPGLDDAVAKSNELLKEFASQHR